MSVEQAEEAARKLAATIKEAIGKIAGSRQSQADETAQRTDVSKDQSQTGS